MYSSFHAGLGSPHPAERGRRQKRLVDGGSLTQASQVEEKLNSIGLDATKELGTDLKRKRTCGLVW